MSAADSPEQSAKRVVSKCGLMGLSAAVFHTQRQKDILKWLRGEKRIHIDSTRMPRVWAEFNRERDRFWEGVQYELITKDKK